MTRSRFLLPALPRNQERRRSRGPVLMRGSGFRTWGVARAGREALRIVALAALVGSLAGCIPPDPSDRPLLTTEALATSRFLDAPELVGADRFELAGEGTIWLTAVGRADPRREAWAIARAGSGPGVRWDGVSCGNDYLRISGSEAIAGYANGVSIWADGKRGELEVRLQSATENSSYGSLGPRLDFDASCPEDLAAELRAFAAEEGLEG